jgi:hypothetical protein
VTISAIQGPWLALPAKPPVEQRPLPALQRTDPAAVPPVQPLSRDPVPALTRQPLSPGQDDRATAGRQGHEATSPPPPDLKFPDPLPDLPKIDLPAPQGPAYAAARDILQTGNLPARQLR